MKKYMSFLVLFFIISSGAFGQKYFSKTAEIAFFSSTPMENIEAKSNTSSTVLDMATGNIQWAVLVKSFEFEKALMQEHFNENYMESSKFPKSMFKGKIINYQDIHLTEDGTYTADVVGTLEIHGVSNEISTSAVFEVMDGQISALCKFNLNVKDYGIEIPSVVKDNIAKEINITIKVKYDALD